MYAIIQTGSKQYWVQKGTTINVEKLTQEVGSEFEIPQVLVVGGEKGQSKIGQPFVEGSKVKAKVVQHIRGPKLLVFKKRSKKGYKKMQGHRQNLTQIQINEVVA